MGRVIIDTIQIKDKFAQAMLQIFWKDIFD